MFGMAMLPSLIDMAVIAKEQELGRKLTADEYAAELKSVFDKSVEAATQRHMVAAGQFRNKQRGTMHAQLLLVAVLFAAACGILYLG